MRCFKRSFVLESLPIIDFPRYLRNVPACVRKTRSRFASIIALCVWSLIWSLVVSTNITVAAPHSVQSMKQFRQQVDPNKQPSDSSKQMEPASSNKQHSELNMQALPPLKPSAADARDYAKTKKLLFACRYSDANSICERHLAKKADPLWMELQSKIGAYGGHRDYRSVMVKACNLRPTDPELLGTAAFVFHEAGDERHAVELAQRALKFDRENASAHAVNALYMQKTGNFGADAEMRQAVKKDPKNFDVLLMNAEYVLAKFDPEPARQAYDQLVNAYPDSALAYLKRAHFLLKTRDHAAAVTDLTKILSLNSDVNEALGLRAKANASIQRWQPAIDDFTLYIKLCNPGPVAYGRRAVCYAQLKKYNEAIADYDIALYQMLGWKSGQPLSTATVAKHTYHEADDFRQWWLDRVQLLETVGKKDRALADVQTFRTIYKDDDDAMIIEERLLTENKDPNKALALLNVLIMQEPNVPRWYRARSAVLTRLGKKAESVADTNKARQMEKSVRHHDF